MKKDNLIDQKSYQSPIFAPGHNNSNFQNRHMQISPLSTSANNIETISPPFNSLGNGMRNLTKAYDDKESFREAEGSFVQISQSSKQSFAYGQIVRESPDKISYFIRPMYEDTKVGNGWLSKWTKKIKIVSKSLTTPIKMSTSKNGRLWRIREEKVTLLSDSDEGGSGIEREEEEDDDELDKFYLSTDDDEEEEEEEELFQGLEEENGPTTPIIQKSPRRDRKDQISTPECGEDILPRLDRGGDGNMMFVAFGGGGGKEDEILIIDIPEKEKEEEEEEEEEETITPENKPLNPTEERIPSSSRPIQFCDEDFETNLQDDQEEDEEEAKEEEEDQPTPKKKKRKAPDEPQLSVKRRKSSRKKPTKKNEQSLLKTTTETAVTRRSTRERKKAVHRDAFLGTKASGLSKQSASHGTWTI